jgi:uncharacterized circularly permuted ATP-grasp superfamily protein/uncharacterized alpha-E superfamily protein
MNLARDQVGNWKILADRTQAPSGAGYALENRIVLSRTFPEVFRHCQVQRLASFFRAMKENLFNLATRHRENPRIALFTPGPFNETYFEHSYLARYLGYSLVEGADLAVRDEGVFLKTLGGLLPIDVILRRLDDDFCDPLELREDSQLGIPGMVQSVRSGNVAVANALGSGWAESAALTAFLPALCRHFFNEDLRLPSVKTWWCGEPGALQYVREHLDELVIKPAVPGVTSWHDPRAKSGHHIGFEPVFGNRLPAADRERLLKQIEERPYEYAAQETLALPTIPVWTGQDFRPRHWVLRTYLTASGGSYLAMPGGLTRVTSDADSMVVSMQRGGGSKDTWVLSEGPVSSFSLLRPPGQPIELRRGGIDLPSRVADNLFWLGRYAERAEGTVRLLRGLLGRLTDETGLTGLPELPSLLRMLTLLGYLPPASQPTPADGARERFSRLESELLSVITNEKMPGSLHNTLRALRAVAWIVRDRISLDAWRILNQLDRELERTLRAEVLNTNDALAMLNRLVMTLAGFSGLGMESMTRGQGWRFLDIGRRVERSIQTVNLLRGARLESGEEEGPVLEAVLEIADSSMTYRSRYLSSLQVVPVLDLLLMDETNPRSVAFQFAALQEHMEALPRDPSPAVLAAEQRVVLSVLARLRLVDLEKLCDSREDGTRPRLEELLADLAREIPVLSDALTRNYLAHAETARQLSMRTEASE